MNTIEIKNGPATEQNFTDRCVQSCKKLLAGIAQAKNRLANDYYETLEANGQLVQLALNEAESLAWQTAYPYLLFPSLAVEKVQAVAAWQTRQQSIRRHHSIFAEAA